MAFNLSISDEALAKFESSHILCIVVDGTADELRRVIGAHRVIFVATLRYCLVLGLFLNSLEVGAELGSEGVEATATSGSTRRRTGR